MSAPRRFAKVITALALLLLAVFFFLSPILLRW